MRLKSRAGYNGARTVYVYFRATIVVFLNFILISTKYRNSNLGIVLPDECKKSPTPKYIGYFNKIFITFHLPAASLQLYIKLGLVCVELCEINYTANFFPIKSVGNPRVTRGTP